jgi:ATP-binding cassette, subfamily B, bacterial
LTKANQTSYRVNVRRGLVLSLVFPSLNLIGGVMTAILVYTGGLSAAQGMVTVGAWYLFLLSLDRFLFPVMSLSSFWTQVQSVFRRRTRVCADRRGPERGADRSAAGGAAEGRGEFEHVEFHYKPSEPVLRDFNPAYSAGRNVALVGHTGAGKSIDCQADRALL